MPFAILKRCCLSNAPLFTARENIRATQQRGRAEASVRIGIAATIKRMTVALLGCLLIGGHANLPAALGGSRNQGDEVARLTANLPFAMRAIELPRFPGRSVRVTEFGATGDGRARCTEAFARAIEQCAKAGGGKVIVPPGIWLTGPIQLKSNINLHLERGAVILFSPRFEDYPLIETTWESSPHVRCVSPLSGKGLENIAVTGDGVIDGSGDAWRMVKKSKLTPEQWKKLVASGGTLDKAGDTWWPSVEAMNGADYVRKLEQSGGEVSIGEYAKAREYLRPVLVSLVDCKRVLLDGPTFQNSPAWNIHPLLCEDIVIRNVKALNPWYSQNGDGLDLESCRRALVYNCQFDVGDDAICIKSGRDQYGRRRGRACEEVVIADCIVYHGHGGVTIGSEMSGGVRNISVRRCTFLGTDMGLRFKTTRGRGGVVEKIWISDIVMKDIPTDAIGFNMYYGGQSPVEQGGDTPSRAPQPVNEGTPQFREIYLKNITCRGAERAVQIEGLPEMPIQRVTLENAQITARTGITCVDAEHIELKDVRINRATGPVITVRDSRDVMIDRAGDADAADVFLKVEGERTKDIRVSNTDTSKARKAVELGKGVPDGAVIRR